MSLALAKVEENINTAVELTNLNTIVEKIDKNNKKVQEQLLMPKKLEEMSLALAKVEENINTAVELTNLNTIVEKIDKNNPENNLVALKRATNILKNNGLVAFPTETVYGLGANALKNECVEKIYLAKGRPSDNPLIVHISKLEDVYKLAKNVPKLAIDIMKKFWPGALTIILEKNEIVPEKTSGGLNTVAIRMPSNKIALALIEKAGFPIAAPSANISGKPSPTNASHVFKDLNSKIDMILDGGDCDFGLESTIIEILENKINILRPGNITKEMLAEVSENIFIDSSILEDNKTNIAKCPGMKYKHYAPKGNITIFKGDMKNICEKMLDLLEKEENEALAIVFSENIKDYPQFSKYKTLNIGSIKNNKK